MGYVDVFWALGMAVAAVMAGVLGEGSLASRVLVALFGGGGAVPAQPLGQRQAGGTGEGLESVQHGAVRRIPVGWFWVAQHPSVALAEVCGELDNLHTSRRVDPCSPYPHGQATALLDLGCDLQTAATSFHRTHQSVNIHFRFLSGVPPFPAWYLGILVCQSPTPESKRIST